ASRRTVRVVPRLAGSSPTPAAATILVVDDEAASRDLLARWLREFGHRVLVAEGGEQGLSVLRDEPVDVVLVDLVMPGMNGFEVLEERQGDPRLQETPFIMISARTGLATIVDCIEMGADEFLPKPFDPVLLQARVNASLERKRLRDQERALLGTVRDQAASLAELNETLETRVRQQVEEIGRLAQLRRFLSPQVADAVVSAGDAVLATHRSEIAVLFCDLRGFTAFAEAAEPEEVMEVLAAYHETVGSLIHRFEAAVGFFAGDGLMVFFNDPVPVPDPAERAVRLAVEMRAAMSVPLAQWRKRGHLLGFAEGVAFGYATLGQIGFEGRYDYGVIGSVVNLAARLCDQAAAGQVLISGRVHLAVRGRFDVDDPVELSLKGFHAPVRAFNVK
ncbi:MAG: adenylate/guanylate cyclase domain-containing protein, partial [Acidimicrobiales bacterium]